MECSYDHFITNKFTRMLHLRKLKIALSTLELTDNRAVLEISSSFAGVAASESGENHLSNKKTYHHREKVQMNHRDNPMAFTKLG